MARQPLPAHPGLRLLSCVRLWLRTAASGPALAALTGLLAAGASGCDANTPPALGLLADTRVVVGETLRLVLRGSDPDGDRLRFRSPDLPPGASITSTAPAEALLVWSPLITDTVPGGRRHVLRIEVDDGRGGSSSQPLGVLVFPAFGTPAFATPAGAVLNLANASRFGLRVAVRDDDSTDVSLSLVDGPAGARLSQDERKGAWFHWEPDPSQRQVSVHRAIFRADDGTHRVDHVLTLVLMNGEPQSGCDGTPPELSHAGLPDQFDSATIPITVAASDTRSAVTQVLVQYTRDDVSTTDAPALSTLALTRDPEDPARWQGAIPVGALPEGGALIHYALLATDDDDPRGFACDLATRLPRRGFFSVAAYPRGTPPSACLNDADEPDDDRSLAPSLAATDGTVSRPGRRLCPNDVDLVRLAARPGEESQVTARWPEAWGDLTLAVVDASGRVLAEGARVGPGEAAVRHTHPDEAATWLQVTPSIPGLRLGYTLEMALRDIPCGDDDHEPDDGPAEARPLASGETVTGTLCPTDADVLRLDVAAGEVWQVALAFDHVAGDLDLEVLAEDGATVLARAASERSLEAVVFEADGAGPRFVRVIGSGLATNVYQLSVERLGDVSCPPDALGEPFTPATAAALFDGVQEALVTCSAASDWFTLDLNGGETVSLLTAGDPVRLALHADPSAAPLAVSETGPDGYAELIETLDRGRYWYAVTTSRDRATYELLQEVVDPAGPCAPDRYDALPAPVALGDGLFRRLRLCSASARDRFSVTLPPFARLTAFTNHAADATSRLTLFGPDGQRLDDGVDWGEGVYLERVIESGGTCVLEVAPGPGLSRLVYDLALFID